MSCGIGCRHGSDPVLLWCRLAAVTPIWPLAWELPYAVGVALRQKKEKKKKGIYSWILIFREVCPDIHEYKAIWVDTRLSFSWYPHEETALYHLDYMWATNQVLSSLTSPKSNILCHNQITTLRIFRISLKGSEMLRLNMFRPSITSPKYKKQVDS